MGGIYRFVVGGVVLEDADWRICCIDFGNFNYINQGGRQPDYEDHSVSFIDKRIDESFIWEYIYSEVWDDEEYVPIFEVG